MLIRIYFHGIVSNIVNIARVADLTSTLHLSTSLHPTDSRVRLLNLSLGRQISWLPHCVVSIIIDPDGHLVSIWVDLSVPPPFETSELPEGALERLATLLRVARLSHELAVQR